MKEVELKFEREDLAGLVAVGTYLSDAARQFGIELPDEQFGERNYAVVKIIKGGELLSALTKSETELLSDDRRAQNERFAEQVKVEKSGELIVMSAEKKVEEKATEEATREKYRKDFEELPLQGKISALLELESIALSETLNFIVNSPSKLVSMAMDVLAVMGLKLEDDARKQSRPAEHRTADGEPSVTEAESDVNAEPSVTEDESGDGAPSVKEPSKTAAKPSVSEPKAETHAADDEIEPPPPSVKE